MAARTERKPTSKRSPKTARTSTTVRKAKEATAPARRITVRKAKSRELTGTGIVKRFKDATFHIPIVGNVVDTKS